jgi:hypothetical protein
MPYKGGVQLLPETQRRPTLSSYTSGNSFFWAGVVLGIGIVVIGATLGSYGASIVATLNTQIGQFKTLEATRNKDQEQRLIAVSRQSKVMRQLLSSKVYWSQALAAMERMTQSNVKFDQLGASLDKSAIAFHGTADTYATVARQIAAFVDGTGITDVSITSVRSTSDGGVEFDGKLLIDTTKLLTKATPTPPQR